MSNYQIHIAVDATAHSDYCLSQPVTYKIAIPVGLLVGAKAYHRHINDLSTSWIQFTEKQYGDQFSNIEAVRFDYPGHWVYVSLAFDGANDDVYIKVTDAAGAAQLISYDSVCSYYDNRVCAVTFTYDGDALGDSGGGLSDPVLLKLLALMPHLQTAHCWAALGFCTHGGATYPDTSTVITDPMWAAIDAAYGNGYWEVSNHSHGHPAGDSIWNWQIATCENWCIQKLTNFPAHQLKGATKYLSSWIEPMGYSNLTQRTCLGSTGDVSWPHKKYLCDRAATTDNLVIGNPGSEDYHCIVNHVPADNNRPTSGAFWASYWVDNFTTGQGKAWWKTPPFTIPATFPEYLPRDNWGTWDATHGLYGRSCHSSFVDSDTVVAMEAKFDEVYSWHGIWIGWGHPKNADAAALARLDSLLSYISGRPDVWYVGWHGLYQYRYMTERPGIVTVTEEPIDAIMTMGGTLPSWVFSGISGEGFGVWDKILTQVDSFAFSPPAGGACDFSIANYSPPLYDLCDMPFSGVGAFVISGNLGTLIADMILTGSTIVGSFTLQGHAGILFIIPEDYRPAPGGAVNFYLKDYLPPIYDEGDFWMYGYSVLRCWKDGGWFKIPILTYTGGALQYKPLKRWTGSLWATIDVA
jgi:hypothetical protein